MTERLAGLSQPDQRSCGAACLVAARMLTDPAYAAAITPDRFATDVLALHRRLTGPFDARGALQLPWPQTLGTPPWAVARQLSALHLELAYTARLVLGRDAAFARLAAATAPSALYVGSRWVPRHVVLVVGGSATTLRVYEPSRGCLVETTRDEFLGARLGLAGWHKPWFVVTPR